MKFLHHILAAVLCAVLLSGCVNDDLPQEQTAPVQGDVQLVFRVSLNSLAEGAEMPTRAPKAGETTGFETPTDPYEAAVHTLRIIIVRGTQDHVNPYGEIEYNRLMDLSDAAYDPALYGEFTFKVKGNEKKRVILIANEEALPELFRNTLADAVPYSEIPTNLYEACWEASAVDATLVNNEGAEKHFIPMTEFFDIDTADAVLDSDNNPVLRDEFFLTRAVTKFRFSVLPADTEGEIPDWAEPNPFGPGFKISKIEINQVASTEYIFPTQTVYSPAKYTAAGADGGRYIDSFSVPYGQGLKTLTFTPANFGGKGTAFPDVEDTYNPLLYFPETRLSTDNAFNVVLTLQMEEARTGKPYTQDFYLTLDPASLTNLPQLPRNTIVDIQISFKRRELAMTATLVPYFYVDLKPIFGFDDIIYHPDTYEDLTDEEKTENGITIDSPDSH